MFSIDGVWLSLVERYVRDVEAAGSNPVTPICKKPYSQGFFYFRDKFHVKIRSDYFSV